MSALPSFEHDTFQVRDLVSYDREIDALTQRYKDLAEELINEDEEKVDEKLEQFKKNLDDIQIPLTSRSFLLKFLRSANHDVQLATKILKNYLKFLKENPQNYKNMTTSFAKEAFKQNIISILPHRDQFGRRIYFYCPGSWDPDVISYQDAFITGITLLEMISLEPKTQVAGVTVICDARDFGYKQFRCVTMKDCLDQLKLMQDCFPVWFRVFHVINSPKFFKMLYNMLKPFIPEEVRERIIVHQDNQSLHEHLNPEMLPNTLGGKLDKMGGCESFETVAKMDDFFLQFNEMRLKQ